jgi:hypothetical protein
LEAHQLATKADGNLRKAEWRKLQREIDRDTRAIQRE